MSRALNWCVLHIWRLFEGFFFFFFQILSLQCSFFTCYGCPKNSGLIVLYSKQIPVPVPVPESPALDNKIHILDKGNAAMFKWSPFWMDWIWGFLLISNIGSTSELKLDSRLWGPWKRPMCYFRCQIISMWGWVLAKIFKRAYHLGIYKWQPCKTFSLWQCHVTCDNVMSLVT